MKLLILILACCSGLFATCTATITSPAASSTVTYLTNITATASTCPTAVRFEFQINGHRLWGSGQEANGFVFPNCTAGVCSGTLTTYNFSFLYDGTHVITVQVLDSAGTVLATSPGVSVILDDRMLSTSPGNGLSLTSPSLGSPLSGTVTFTAQAEVSTSRNAAIAATNYVAFLNNLDFYVDGLKVCHFVNVTVLTASEACVWDSTTVPNGSHDLHINTGTWDASTNNPSTAPIQQFEAQFTTSNGTTPMELRLTDATSYLWLGGTSTVTLSPRLVYTDGTESAKTATFVSDTPLVATVAGGCSSAVSSCLVTGVADTGNGYAMVTATYVPAQPITLVNTAVNSSSSTISSLAAPALNVVTGNALAVFVECATNVLPATVTDTAGNTFAAQTFQNRAGGFYGAQWFVALNVTGNASDIVTLNLTGSNSFNTIIVRQYSGVLASSAIDVTGAGASASGTGLTLTSPAFSTAAYNEVLLAGGMGYGATGYTAGAGYGNLVTDSLFLAVTQDQLVGTIQTGVTATMTQASTTSPEDWMISVLSLIGVGNSYSRTARVVVQNGTPIAPHRCANGALATAYTPNCSEIERGYLASGIGTIQNTSLALPAMVSSGANAWEGGCYFDPVANSYPNLSTWKSDEVANVFNYAIPALAATGFKSFLCLSSWAQQFDQFQSASDPDMSARVAYMLDPSSGLGGKIVDMVQGDETALPPPVVPGGGVIGASNGPVSITVAGGAGAATLNWPIINTPAYAFTIARGYPVTIGNSTNSCLNTGTNTSVNLTGFTYTTTCADGVYAPSGGTVTETGFTVQFFNGNCGENGTPCPTYPPLNIPTPNNIQTTIRGYLQAASFPVPIDFPLVGGAGTNSYIPYNGVFEGTRVSDGGNCYWSGAWDQLPGSITIHSILSNQGGLEAKFWAGCWPGMEHSHPIAMLEQHGGSWTQYGGKTFTLSTTSGSNFTTSTTLNFGQVGSKITVSGSSCNGQYDVTAIVGNTMTVSQSPGCTGSGGTVIVGSGNTWWTPPYDVLHGNGADHRGVGLVPQTWVAAGLPSVALHRAYTWLDPNNDSASYPSSYAAQYADGTGGEAGQDAFAYSPFFGTPQASRQERFQADQISWKLMGRLEPQLLQPPCNAPDLGVGIHTGAKCGSAGTLVIAVSDNESPSTLNFPTSLWSLYNTGGGAITRYQISLASWTTVNNLVSSSTSDSVSLYGPDVVIWYFPSAGTTPLAGTMQIGFKPSSVGAAKTAFYGPAYGVCGTSTVQPTSNLAQIPSALVLGSTTSFAFDPAYGPACYYYQYLDSSNNPVGPRSNVQVIR